MTEYSILVQDAIKTAQKEVKEQKKKATVSEIYEVQLLKRNT